MRKTSLLMLSTCALLTAAPAISEGASTSDVQYQMLNPPEVAKEIIDLDREIAAAEADAASYGGGLIQAMVKSRLETLRLTKAILQNRIVAQEGGATIKITVLGGQPDPELAARILTEIEAQTKLVEEAQRQIGQSGSGGLVGALATSRLETEKMNLAVLRSSWYRAAYGVIAPALAATESPATSPASPQAGQETSSDALSGKVDWADPAYPNIDYGRSIFSQLNREGFRISGWWGISETKAAVDDTVQIFAINVLCRGKLVWDRMGEIR